MLGFSSFGSNDPVQGTPGLFAYWCADNAVNDGSTASSIPNLPRRGTTTRDLVAVGGLSGNPIFTLSDSTFNYRPSISCVAATRRFRAAAFNTAMTYPNTWYMVCNVTATSNTIYYRIGEDGNYSGSPGFTMTTSRTFVSQTQDAGSAITSGAVATGTHVICVVYNGASSAMYVDDSITAFASGTTNNQTSTDIAIGSYAAGTYAWTTQAGYQGAHSQTQRSRIMHALGRKYAIAIDGVSYPARSIGWTPLNDVGIVSGLYLPGSYSTTGTPGVNQVGTWTDQSGNGYNFTNDNAFGETAPTAHASNYPIFGGGSTNGLKTLLASVANTAYDTFCSEASGAIIVIAEYTTTLPTDVGNYQNPTMVSGSGATPHMNVSDAGLRFGGYDGNTYINATNGTSNHLVPTVVAGKWDATGVYQSRAGEAWSSVSAYTGGNTDLDAANIGAYTHIGCGYSLIYQWTGPIKAVAFYTSHTSVDNAKLAQWQTWAVQQGLV